MDWKRSSSWQCNYYLHIVRYHSALTSYSIKTKEDIEKLRLELPELPQARKNRMQEEYTLTDEEVDLLIKDKELGEYFENVMSELNSHNAPLAANYVVTDLQGLLQGSSVKDDGFKITAENFAELITLVAEKKISTPAAKTVLREMYGTGGDPSQIIENMGLAQISDTSQIDSTAQNIVATHAKAVVDYQDGKEQALKFLVGQMMAETKGAIDPSTSEEALKKAIHSLKKG